MVRGEVLDWVPGMATDAFVFFQKRRAESGVLDPLEVAVAIIFVGMVSGLGDGFVFAQKRFRVVTVRPALGAADFHD